jgi:hypothetical protein
VFWHLGREGSCDNLRVRRGGGNSGSGVIDRVNIFLRNYSNAKHHAGTFRCHGEMWCCFDCSDRVALTRGPDSGLRQMFCRLREIAHFRGVKEVGGGTSPSQRSGNSGASRLCGELFFRPAGADFFSLFHPRLAAWAAFFRRFAAGTRRHFAALSPGRDYKPLPPAIEGTSRTSSPS